jgi:transposase InsO family protein
LAALLCAVPADMQAGFTNKESAREAWDSICKIRIGVDRVKEANVQRLRQEFAEIRFKPGEGVEDFSLRITALANELRVLGDEVTDKEVVKKMLHSVPEKLEQVAILMETLLDLNSLSIEEVAGHLRAVEQRKKTSTPPTADAGGRLLLTEEEWTARMKAKEKGGSSGSGGGRGRGHNRGKGHGSGRNGGVASPNARDRHDDSVGCDTCHNCGKTGHWAKDCRSKAKKGEAHTALDDEPSLLLMEVGDLKVESDSPLPPPPVTSPLPLLDPTPPTLATKSALPTSTSTRELCPARGPVHLVEEKVFVQVTGAEEEKECRRWVLDTGATNHMTGCRSAFSDLNCNIRGTVKFGDCSVVQIEGMEMILFHCKNGEHWAFAGIYFIPRLTTNIISVGQLDEMGFQSIIEGGVMRIRNSDRHLLAKVIRSPNRLYVINVEVAAPVCLAARGAESAWLWHARYGHLNFLVLRKLARDSMVRGLPEVEQADQICEGCLAGKHRQAMFPRQAEYRAEEPLALVHGDLCGPIVPATPSDSRYFLLLVDDCSRFMWLRTLRSKDQAADAIKQFQFMAEAETGRKLKAFWTDHGGEFTFVEFMEHCIEQGMRRQMTAPYTPQQNGVVECRNQTVIGTARCLLKSKSLPGWLWGEAVATTVYLLNISPTKALQGMTPFEGWYGKKPAVHHLCTFGCVVHVKITAPNLKKLDDRSKPMVFISYELGSKTYRAYDPVAKRVHVTRDVVFDEQAQWDWSRCAEQEAEAGDDIFRVEMEYMTAVLDAPGAQVMPRSPP